jgi:hypothetical protein
VSAVVLAAPAGAIANCSSPPEVAIWRTSATSPAFRVTPFGGRLRATQHRPGIDPASPPISQLGDIVGEWLTGVDTGSGGTLQALDPGPRLFERSVRTLYALTVMRHWMRPPDSRVVRCSARTLTGLHVDSRTPSGGIGSKVTSTSQQAELKVPGPWRSGGVRVVSHLSLSSRPRLPISLSESQIPFRTPAPRYTAESLS